MSFVRTDDGCQVYYETAGNGDAVILIPGLGGDGRFWSGVVPLLASRFTTVTIDHRGAGRSERPEAGYSIPRIARDVLHVLDAEGIASAHLVGHSTGGTVVQTLALDAAERVRSLTVSGSWARPDARFRELFRARARLIEIGEAATYQRLTHVFGFTSEWIDLNKAQLEAAVEQAETSLQPYGVTAARIRMLLDFDRASDLGGINRPTLLMGARDDVMIPFDRTEELHRLIPHATLREMTGGHFYPRSDAKRFSEVLGCHLDDQQVS